MNRNDATSSCRKALLAAGVVGLGLITYRLWSRRRQVRNDETVQPKVVEAQVQKVKEEAEPIDDAKSVAVLEPASFESDSALAENDLAAVENASVSAATDPGTAKNDSASAENNPASLSPVIAKEHINSGVDSLSVSGTFVKVSPAASPVSFEEIGSSFVEPISMPSTPPLIVEPASLKSDASLSSADSGDNPSDSMNLSSVSFDAVPAEHTEVARLSSDGEPGSSQVSEPTHLEENENGVQVTEKNDIVVIDVASSEESTEKGSGDAEVSEAAKLEDSEKVTDAEAPPQPAQS